MILIQLGKFGDIMNVLPALNEGGKMVVTPPYSTILEGTSYCEAVIRDWDVMAGWREFPEAKCTLRAFPGKTGNWAHDSWAETGLPITEWHTRPLIFDRRDHSRERETLGKYPVDKNTVLFNSAGESFRFWKWKQVRAGLRFKWFDISAIRAVRIYDMLYLFERCKGLITADTSLLHLTYACGTPVVNVGAPDAFHLSPGRAHWLGRYGSDVILSKIDEINTLFGA